MFRRMIRKRRERAAKSKIFVVDIPDGPLRFHDPNEITHGRYASFFTKEPETIEWIDSFERGASLWDIGANIGLYTAYANRTKNSPVVAFEPAAENFALLCANMDLNGMVPAVSTLNVALTSRTGIDCLNMQSAKAGAALSSFGQSADQLGREFIPANRQTLLGFRGDDLREVFSLECPDHIKLDVDGIEHEVVAGLHETLANSRLKSISIELSEEVSHQFNSVKRDLGNAGFKIEWKRHASMFDDHEFASFYNYLFVR